MWVVVELDRSRADLPFGQVVGRVFGPWESEWDAHEAEVALLRSRTRRADIDYVVQFTQPIEQPTYCGCEDAQPNCPCMDPWV